MRCRAERFQQLWDHYMQFTFNKTCFLAYLHREEPLLTAAVKLDEVLNASWESMASRLKSSLSLSAAETAICIRVKRWKEEISMTLMSSDIEQLVMKSLHANGLGSDRDPQACLHISGSTAWSRDLSCLFWGLWLCKRVKTLAAMEGKSRILF